MKQIRNSKLAKKILVLVMIVFVITTSSATSAFAATDTEISNAMNSLQNRFPTGSHWTQDSFAGGSQCYAFARYLANEIFGSYPANMRHVNNGYVDEHGWTCIKNVSTAIVQPGDIIQTYTSDSVQHSALVYQVSGNTIFVAECWSGSYNNEVHWGGYFNGNSTNATLGGIQSKYTTTAVWKHPGGTIVYDNTPPTIEDVYIYNETEIGYTIHCTVRDDTALGRVQFPTWTLTKGNESGNSQDDIIWGDAGPVSGTVTELRYPVDYSAHNNEKNEKYVTHIYCTDAAGNQTVVGIEHWAMGDSIAHYNVTDTGANIRAWLTNSKGDTLRSAGFYFGTSEDDMTRYELYNNIAWTRFYVDTCIDDVRGMPLVPDTKYIYRFYIETSDGTVQSSATKSFTTESAFAAVPETVLSNPDQIVEANGHTYYRYDTPVGHWEQARRACESLGGYLVTITSQDEQNVITNMVNGAPRFGYWSGGSERVKEGVWKWINGEAWGFANWNTSQPDDGNTEEDYLMIYSTPAGKWNDSVEFRAESTENTLGFICEFDYDSSNKYSVTYDANGGTGAPESQQKIEGKALILSESVPSWESHWFDGWALTSDAEEAEYAPGATYTIDGDTTLYAVWTPFCTITYDFNGAGDSKVQTIQTGVESTYLDTDIPDYEDHVFLGWASTDTASEAEYLPGTSFVVENDRTLYAVWREIKHSAWMETRPENVPDSYLETKTQYRYQDKETTSSAEASIEGWTLERTEQHWGEYGPWSNWQDTAITGSDSVKVESRTAYPYYYFYCTNCGMSIRYPYWGSDQVCEICGKTGTRPNNGIVEWFPNPWSDSVAWGTNTGKYYQYIDGGIWWNWTDGAPKTQYRSCTRNLENTYYHYRWGDWSDWSDTEIAATDTRRVESRLVYRYIYPIENVLTLPASLTRIESDAFAGTVAEAVIVPAGVQDIANGAIEAAFIIGEPGTEAEAYATRNGLVFVDVADY